MTLIVAIPARDGVVFGSDAQVTAGAVRSTTTKIFPLNDKALWGASGELALIQRVGEALEALPDKGQPLFAIRDVLAQVIKGAMESLIRLDFRTQFVGQNPDHLAGLHPGDFLFVEYRDRPRVLHVTPIGTSEWVDGRFAATGNGDLFAHALLQKYAGKPLASDRAKLLAYKVIEEAIQVGAYGLGPPVDIWEVGARGVHRETEEQVAALEDAARLLREREVAMLLGEPPVPKPTNVCQAMPAELTETEVMASLRAKVASGEPLAPPITPDGPRPDASTQVDRTAGQPVPPPASRPTRSRSPRPPSAPA